MALTPSEIRRRKMNMLMAMSYAAFASTKAWTPLQLFASGEQGVWYDPSDFSTMFQDSAGTTPVTAVEQPVGLILDKSGRGNHASQSTTTSRPVLSARVNLLTRTDAVSSAWNTGSVSGGSRVGDTLTLSSNEGYAYIGSPNSLTLTAIAHIASFDVTCDQTIANVPFRVTFGTGAGSTLVSLTAGVTQRVSITFTPQAVTASFALGLDARNAIVPGGSNETGYVVTIARPDFRNATEGASLPAYQRVGAATSGSSSTAGSGDYDTTGFPYYLRFDGTDDSLATGTINPGSVDKAQVFAGVRKLSDAAQGQIAELSASAAANNGAFDLISAAAPNTYSFQSRGTVASIATTAASFASPISNVLTGLSDIAADITILRANATQVAQVSTDQGSGNYESYPLYIGRRGGTTLPFNGHLYGLIARFSAANLSASQITSAEAWMNTKTRAY